MKEKAPWGRGYPTLIGSVDENKMDDTLLSIYLLQFYNLQTKEAFLLYSYKLQVCRVNDKICNKNEAILKVVMFRINIETFNIRIFLGVRRCEAFVRSITFLLFILLKTQDSSYQTPFHFISPEPSLLVNDDVICDRALPVFVSWKKRRYCITIKKHVLLQCTSG